MPWISKKPDLKNDPRYLEPKVNEVSALLAQTETEIDKTRTKFKPRKIKPIVTFTFDDGTDKEYLHTYPLLKGKGVKATTSIIADKVGTSGFMTQSQILDMKANGWEIASHSKTHVNLTTLSDSVLTAELKESKGILNGYGFDVKNILYPFGGNDERVRRETAKYYRAARTSGSGTTGDYNDSPINTYRLNSILVGDTTGTNNGIDPISGFMVDTLDHWKYWVDQAISKNLWIIFISHSDVIVANNRLADLGLLIDYVKSKTEVEIKTLDDALNTFENSIDSDKFKVGADGKVTGQYGKTKQSDNDSILNATALSDIEAGMLTFNVVTGGNRTGFPTTQLGGTLVTLKPDNDANRSFQLYKPYGSGNGLFYREYSPDAKNWKDLDNIFVWSTGSLLSDHSPATLKDGKINFGTIATAHASGYPENSAGFLTAYKVDGEWGSIYETYKLKNSPKIYTRYWDSASSKWSDWQQQLNVVQLNSGSFTSTTPVDNYPVGVSYKQITQGESTGFPETTAGLLETRNILWNGYKFQYYHILNTTKTYKRVWKTDTTWSAWTQVNV